MAHSLHLVIASVAKQSRIPPRKQTGLLRCARNDGARGNGVVLQFASRLQTHHRAPRGSSRPSFASFLALPSSSETRMSSRSSRLANTLISQPTSGCPSPTSFLNSSSRRSCSRSSMIWRQGSTYVSSIGLPLAMLRKHLIICEDSLGRNRSTNCRTRKQTNSEVAATELAHRPPSHRLRCRSASHRSNR